MTLDIYSSSSNLGDNLGLTALANVVPGSRIHLYDDRGCRAIGPIFEGVAEVIYDNGQPGGESPKSTDPTHINAPLSYRHLVPYGLVNASAIPKMKLTAAEIAKAKAFVEAVDPVTSAPLYPNPCIIKCSPQVTDVRTPPIEIMADIVKQNPRTTFLNFGLSKNHPKHNFANITVDGLHTFLDLPIREQAAIYHVVGRYVGPDTGDYHLMLSVGGVCDVLVPTSNPSYSYQYFHYNARCWQAEKPRVRYFNWNLPLGQFITDLKHT